MTKIKKKKRERGEEQLLGDGEGVCGGGLAWLGLAWYSVRHSEGQGGMWRQVDINKSGRRSAAGCLERGEG